jgi:hypothetical protein
MNSERKHLGWIAWSVVVPLLFANAGRADAPDERSALIVRLVHPERQATELLGLFAGSRAAHPAAALAAWKRATRDPAQLGKPLEAVIALFNPEMAREWSIMNGSELGFGLRPGDDRLKWYAIVPHDDGTLAAAITAERLSGGAAESPLLDDARHVAVERLGTSRSVFASQLGEAVLAAGSREDLALAVRRFARGLRTVGVDAADHADPIDDGLFFDLAPAYLTVPAPAHLALRRMVELLRGLEFATIRGHLAVKGDRLMLDMTSVPSRPGAVGAPEVAVDPAWLRWVPAAGIMGMASMAIAPDASFWNSTFSLADRVDRADPSHGDAAPVRARLNLLAAGVGARLEADLWPHLRGLTACLMGDPQNPGQPTGALVILHVDANGSADRIATDVLPRMARLLTGRRQAERPVVPAASDEALRLGVAGGKPLTVARRGTDVLLGWGEKVLDLSLEVCKNPHRSIAPLCSNWADAGKRAPRRVGAFWPARCWSPARGSEAPPPAWRVLADGPPAVWWGWDDAEASTLHDTVVFAALRPMTRRFLDELPLEPLPPLGLTKVGDARLPAVQTPTGP